MPVMYEEQMPCAFVYLGLLFRIFWKQARYICCYGKMWKNNSRISTKLAVSIWI